MTHRDDDPPAAPPLIACTLTPAAYSERVTWVADLNLRFRRSHEQRGSTLELVYGPSAASEVDELRRREAECCAFLRFTTAESTDEIRLRIEAPPEAGADAALFFAPLLAGAHPRPLQP